MHIYKIIALCITIGLVSIALLLYTKPQQTHKTANRNRTDVITNQMQKPDTILSFSPSNLTLTGSESAQITIIATTGQNAISAAQLELRYDTSIITISNFSPATFFPSPTPLLHTHDRNRGRIDYVLSIAEQTELVSGEGILASFTVTRNSNATGSANTKIDLLPKTSVRSRQQQSSLLKSTGNMLIELEAAPL